jgi:hypothetical protein
MDRLTTHDAAIVRYSPKHTYAAWKLTASTKTVLAARALRRTEKNKVYKRSERTLLKASSVAMLYEYASMPLPPPHSINFHVLFAHAGKSAWTLGAPRIYPPAAGACVNEHAQNVDCD